MNVQRSNNSVRLLLAAIIIIFLVSWSLIRLRVFLTKGKIKRAARDPVRGQDVQGNLTDPRDSSMEVKPVSA